MGKGRKRKEGKGMEEGKERKRTEMEGSSILRAFRCKSYAKLVLSHAVLVRVEWFLLVAMVCMEHSSLTH